MKSKQLDAFAVHLNRQLSGTVLPLSIITSIIVSIVLVDLGDWYVAVI